MTEIDLRKWDVVKERVEWVENKYRTAQVFWELRLLVGVGRSHLFFCFVFDWN